MISKKVIQDLLRKGLIWQYVDGTNFNKLLTAIANSFDTVKIFFDNLRDQSLPNKATDSFLLLEWCSIFNINLDLSEEERQILAKTYYTTVGGQDFDYFKAQLEASGFLSSTASPILQDTGMDSQCGVAECGLAESAGNGANIHVIYKGPNEGTTRFYRTGGSADIPIPSGTLLSSTMVYLTYQTTSAVTLLGASSYVDAPIQSLEFGDIDLLTIGEELDLNTPITNIDTTTQVQTVTYLGKYAYTIISNLVEYIRPLTASITYQALAS